MKRIKHIIFTAIIIIVLQLIIPIITNEAILYKKEAQAYTVIVCLPPYWLPCFIGDDGDDIIIIVGVRHDITKE